MKPRKKGQQYEISYRCPGYRKPFYERFSSYQEANLRIAQIEYENPSVFFSRPSRYLLLSESQSQNTSQLENCWMNTCRSTD